MTVEVVASGRVDAPWRGLVRLGAAAAVIVVMMIRLQATVFILSPPPTTVEGFCASFQENPCAACSTFDLLLTLDYLLLALDYLVMLPFNLAPVPRLIPAGWRPAARCFSGATLRKSL